MKASVYVRRDFQCLDKPGLISVAAFRTSPGNARHNQNICKCYQRCSHDAIRILIVIIKAVLAPPAMAQLPSGLPSVAKVEGRRD